MATRSRRPRTENGPPDVGVGLAAEAALDARIVDAAIALAEDVGWDDVRLSRVAVAVGIPLAELTARFRDPDAIADAWFARGRAAMCATDPDEAGLPVADRLAVAMLRWFDALAVHRRVTTQMLQVKLWPFHPHHWVPMVFSLSRHIQLWRDVAGLAAGGPRRAIEEVTLTWLFLATLAVWTTDQTPAQERTRAFLRARLAAADSGARRVFAAATGEGPSAPRCEP
jgi:AcrR family transcriptional regulator